MSIDLRERLGGRLPWHADDVQGPGRAHMGWTRLFEVQGAHMDGRITT